MATRHETSAPIVLLAHENTLTRSHLLTGERDRVLQHDVHSRVQGSAVCQARAPRNGCRYRRCGSRRLAIHPSNKPRASSANHREKRLDLATDAGARVQHRHDPAYHPPLHIRACLDWAGRPSGHGPLAAHLPQDLVLLTQACVHALQNALKHANCMLVHVLTICLAFKLPRMPLDPTCRTWWRVERGLWMRR